MLFREAFGVYYENHTKHTNTLYAKNVKLLMSERVVAVCFEAVFLNPNYTGDRWNIQI
jgi:hypothetical protein